jgi:hypothetical protein
VSREPLLQSSEIANPARRLLQSSEIADRAAAVAPIELLAGPRSVAMGLQLYVLAQQGQLRLQVLAGKASCDSHGHRDQESCGSDGPRGGAEPTATAAP